MNNLAKLLRDAKRNGVAQGEFLMSQITLIALENTMNNWDIPVDDQFYKDMEKEMRDLRTEILESVPSGNVEEMAERISFYVDEIRARRHMDEED